MLIHEMHGILPPFSHWQNDVVCKLGVEVRIHRLREECVVAGWALRSKAGLTAHRQAGRGRKGTAISLIGDVGGWWGRFENATNSSANNARMHSQEGYIEIDRAYYTMAKRMPWLLNSRWEKLNLRRDETTHGMPKEQDICVVILMRRQPA